MKPFRWAQGAAICPQMALDQSVGGPVGAAPPNLVSSRTTATGGPSRREKVPLEGLGPRAPLRVDYIVIRAIADPMFNDASIPWSPTRCRADRRLMPQSVTQGGTGLNAPDNRGFKRHRRAIISTPWAQILLGDADQSGLRRASSCLRVRSLLRCCAARRCCVSWRTVPCWRGACGWCLRRGACLVCHCPSTSRTMWSPRSLVSLSRFMPLRPSLPPTSAWCGIRISLGIGARRRCMASRSGHRKLRLDAHMATER